MLRRAIWQKFGDTWMLVDGHELLVEVRRLHVEEIHLYGLKKGQLPTSALQPTYILKVFFVFRGEVLSLFRFLLAFLDAKDCHSHL